MCWRIGEREEGKKGQRDRSGNRRTLKTKRRPVDLPNGRNINIHITISQRETSKSQRVIGRLGRTKGQKSVLSDIWEGGMIDVLAERIWEILRTHLSEISPWLVIGWSCTRSEPEVEAKSAGKKEPRKVKQKNFARADLDHMHADKQQAV